MKNSQTNNRRNHRANRWMAGMAATAAAVFLLSGCAQGQGRMTYIGADAAKKQILELTGLNESQVKIESVDMATKNGMDYYQVEFSDENGNTYHYDVDALTGKVIESQAAGDKAGETVTAAAETSQTALAASAAETSAAAPAASVAETSAAAPAASAAETSAAAAGTREISAPAAAAGVMEAPSASAGAQKAIAASGSSGAAISADAAKEKALAHAGLNASQVTFTKTQLDWDDGRRIYEVDFYGNDGTEYEYEIKADTGDVVKYDIDKSGRPVPEANTVHHSESAFHHSDVASGGGSTILSEESARQMALAQVPGATVANIVEFETDRDDGRIQYEGKIYYGGMEYEFEIDAYSGAFRKWESERDD